MICFDQVTEDVVLDCDKEPKTRFKLRSLRFSDLAKVEEAKDAIGALPPSSLRLLQKRVIDGGVMSDEETEWLDINYRRSIAGEIKTCALGVIEVDCHPVTPEEVEQMLDTIPLAMRDSVRTELSRRVTQLGAPAPKSEKQSE